jgi:parvulin-like peptidyl-prolyl isomerase
MVYDRYAQYFFKQICTVQSSAFNQADAKALQASGVPNGHPACYDQDAFAAQPPSFQNAVLGLAVGKTAPPIPTVFGYLVVRVVSRTEQGFTPDVQRVLSTAVLSAQGSPNTTLDGLVAKANVKVNPTYGSWKSSQVVPPAAPSTGV